MRTLGQERSEFALEKVLANIQEERLKPFSAGAPSMILQNGFGQTLAFWKAKGKNEHNIMFDIVQEWFLKKKFAKGSTAHEFLTDISVMDQSRYLKAQMEALALLEWVKRYAHAFIEK